jgi:hypothetical protein
MDRNALKERGFTAPQAAKKKRLGAFRPSSFLLPTRKHQRGKEKPQHALRLSSRFTLVPSRRITMGRILLSAAFALDVDFDL